MAQVISCYYDKKCLVYTWSPIFLLLIFFQYLHSVPAEVRIGQTTVAFGKKSRRLLEHILRTFVHVL